MRTTLPIVLLAVAAVACQPASPATDAPSAAPSDDPVPPIELASCTVPNVDGEVLCGSHEVWEDREAKTGRVIALNIVVLPAFDPRPERGPFVWLHGGPGAGATTSAARFAQSWQREHHDIVLVDQRGTGESNPLDCDLSRPDDTAQAFLEGPFERTAEIAECRDALGGRADLALYTTPIFADDVNEIRRGLGYDKINLYGGSYGTRASLVYMRRHPDTVRTAVLSGVAPISFTNPLFHSSEAQKALDATLAECAADAECSAAFPDLATKFDELIARLDAEPATVAVSVGDGRGEADVLLTREGFAEGLRVFMYYMPRARRVPLLIHRAWEGDYRPFAEVAINSARGIRGILKFGLLLSVTCAEDIPRIDPASIPEITGDTFLKDDRVRDQMAACTEWPRGHVPADYGEPVRADVPVLVMSGNLDPVTGPNWGAVADRNLPNSLHLVMPGAHGVAGDCVDAIFGDFLAAGTLEGLDTSCVADMELPPFALE